MLKVDDAWEDKDGPDDDAKLGWEPREGVEGWWLEGSLLRHDSL